MADIEITCRVKTCRLTMLQKNYKTHLQRKHPTEDSSDLSAYGQLKLTFKRKSTEGPKEPDKSDVPQKVQKVDNINEKSTNTDVKLDLILSEIVDLKKKVSELQENNKRVHDLHSTKTETAGDDLCDTLRSWKLARTISDLEDLGFKYYPDESLLKCILCTEDSIKTGRTHYQAITNSAGSFIYSAEYPVDFSEQYFTPEFKNLKLHVKSHLTTNSHSMLLRSKQEKEEEEMKLINRNRKVGMVLARICHKNYILGRPYTDYETDVLNSKLNGVDVGELNHSRKFPAEFRPYVDKVVTHKAKEFITTPLEQTGHLPPVAISADKGTYKHRSRQFLMCVTVNPDGKNLLEVISCGQPVVKSGSTGLELVKNMKEGFDALGIKGEQIKSAVFDGVYFHCNVSAHMQEVYGVDPDDILYSWDGLHKCGLVDKHISERSDFAWLVNDTESCQQLFIMFNWGANYEKYQQASALWKLKLKNLVTFSETRFANSRRKVYLNTRHSFAAIMTCLEQAILEESKLNLNKKEDKDRAAKVREKALKCRQVKGKIMNTRFQLTLSSLADIYDQFGKVVNVAQMVHLLPHERMDLYFKAVGEFKLMEKYIEHHSNCKADSVQCPWKLNHTDKITLDTHKTIRELPVLDEHEEKAAGLQCITRYLRKEKEEKRSEGAVYTSDNQLVALVKALHEGLSTEVYTPKAIKAIEITRSILDVSSLALKLKKVSFIKLACTEFPNLVNGIEDLPVTDLVEVPRDELKQQHKLFMQRLESITKPYSDDDLNKMDSKEILKKFFSTKEKLYRDIEMVMHAMSCMMVVQSCESVLESLVSQYENHFDDRRNVDEETANEEFNISVNGPCLAHSDVVLKEAMDNYWGKSPWHFVRSTRLEHMIPLSDSTVLKRLTNTHSKLPVMEK